MATIASKKHKKPYIIEPETRKIIEVESEKSDQNKEGNNGETKDSTI